MNSIQEHITKRGDWLLSKIRKCIDPEYHGRFYIAGGAMAGTPNDVDLFPHPGSDPPKIVGEIVGKTKNATTYDVKPWPIQVCHYSRPTIKELVESFDYSHIQVGCCVSTETWTVVDVAYTKAYLISRVTGETRFTGSEYPLSSMLRAGKYYKRDTMTRGVYMMSVLSSLCEVVDRGFEGYEDFKDQLDAVDLGLIPEEIKDCTPMFMRLYELLNRRRP